MSKLPLSFACWDYDRIKAITDGTIQIPGIELNYLNLSVEETFWRMLRHQEFDLSEMSLSSYMIARDRGFPKFTAIPVFMSRFFRHSCIFINSRAGIKEPSDLKGKRVGVPEYQMTAALWIRGILHHEYGVKASDVQWFSGGEEQPGRVEKLALHLPPEIHIQPIGPTQTLNAMLEEGELDALVTARAPSAFLKGSPNIQRLFPNYVEVEKEYYKKTGIFPIMHLVAIRDEVLEEHPWVAANLYKAFVAAKEEVYKGLFQTAALKTTLPWLLAEVESTRQLMGDDYWPYGVEKNRKTLQAAVTYSYEQGLISKPIEVEDLFVKSTLDEFKV